MTYSVLTTSTLIVFILVVRKLAMNHIPQWLFPLFWWTVILRIMVRAQFVLSVPVEESEPIDVNGALIMEGTAIKDQINSTELKVFLSIITGIILTKLDGTAKGGIIIPIKEELGIPVKLVGVGEKIDDLQPFVPRDYVEALFE